MESLEQSKVIPFPGTTQANTNQFDREKLRNMCYMLAGMFECIGDQCLRGEKDETDVIEGLEREKNKVRERISKIQQRGG